MNRLLARISYGCAMLPVIALAQAIPPNPVLLPTTTPVNDSTANVGTLPPRGLALYLTGKVAVQDGGELPLDVVILRVCGSNRLSLGYADRKGNFSVRAAGHSLASIADASEDQRGGTGSLPSAAREQGGSDLMGCALQAMATGYRSGAIDISSQRTSDNSNVGTLILRRTGNAGGIVSETMLTAPKPALKSYQRGMDALRKNDDALALKEFQKAVELHPVFANAWYQLGHFYLDVNETEARADLDKAMAADPHFALPYTDAAILAYRARQWDRVIELTDRGIHLESSGFPALYYFNAAAQFNERNLPEAEKRARETLKLDVDRSLPKTQQLLSYILAARGDFAGAVEQMRAYIALGLSPADAETAGKELTQLQARADAVARTTSHP